MQGEITVFSGNAHRELAADICDRLGTPLQASRTTRFANDCLEVQLLANCRERDVFIVQPIAPPMQDNLVELLLMLDAARGASAARTRSSCRTTPTPDRTRRTRRGSRSAPGWWPT